MCAQFCIENLGEIVEKELTKTGKASETVLKTSMRNLDTKWEPWMKIFIALVLSLEAIFSFRKYRPSTHYHSMNGQKTSSSSWKKRGTTPFRALQLRV